MYATSAEQDERDGRLHRNVQQANGKGTKLAEGATATTTTTTTTLVHRNGPMFFNGGELLPIYSPEVFARACREGNLNLAKQILLLGEQASPEPYFKSVTASEQLSAGSRALLILACVVGMHYIDPYPIGENLRRVLLLLSYGLVLATIAEGLGYRLEDPTQFRVDCLSQNNFALFRPKGHGHNEVLLDSLIAWIPATWKSEIISGRDGKSPMNNPYSYPQPPQEIGQSLRWHLAPDYSSKYGF